MLPTPPPRETPRPSPTPDWSRSPAPPETVVVDGVTWQRLYADSLPPVDTIVLDGSSGGQLLAMGEVSYCPTYCVSSDWYLMTSKDGVSWSVLGKLPGEPNLISTVFDDGSEYFAGGSIENNGVVGPVGIWWSQNGVDWTSVDDQGAFHHGSCSSTRGFIDRFYLTSDGMVASGSGTWFSSDGKHWRCEDNRPLYSVAAGNGAYVGVGDGPDADSTTLWRSTDGINWSESQTVSEYVDVASVAKGFVAVTDGNPMSRDEQLMLISEDGNTWTQPQWPFGSKDVYGLASDGRRATVAEESDGRNTSSGAVWISSTDGSAWTSYQLPKGDGDQVDDDVALMGNTVVVTGDAGDGGTVMWVAQIP